MSRLGQSVHPLVLGPTVPAIAVLPADAGRPPLAPGLAVGLAVWLDAVILVASPVLAHRLLPAHPGLEARAALLLLLPLGLAAIAAAGGYRIESLLHGRAALGQAVGGGAVALGVVALAVAVLRAPDDLQGGWPALVALLLGGGLAAARGLLAGLLRPRRHRGFAPRTVIVGGGAATARLAERLRAPGHHAPGLVGFVADAVAADAAGTAGLAYLGPTEQVFGLARRDLVDRVVLALPWSDEARILGLVRRLADFPVEVCLAPDCMAYAGRTRAWPCGVHMVHLADRPLSGRAAVVKRAEDLLIGGFALLLCAIPMAAIALAVRLDSPGPVLFRQRRTGFANRDFEMLKFRTMYHHMADHEVRQQTTLNDPRVTRVGAILRRTSLDELPQLFNVLRGEMSIVGPRPHAPGTRAGGRPFEQVVERYAARHRVRPGLTGLAQVRGLRGETRTEDRIIRRVESDLEYIETWSLWLDLRILARTAVIVLRMNNAY